MPNKERKIPIQKRSLEKRNLILSSGFQLIMEKGFHNVTTDDIAREANISVGIIYRYFDDKKALLLAALNAYVDRLGEEICPSEVLMKMEWQKSLAYVLDLFVSFHEENISTHEELESLRHSDPDVAMVYDNLEKKIIENLKKILPDSILQKPHLQERLILTTHLVEAYCHIIMKTGNGLNIDFMKQQVLDSIVLVLE